MHLGNLSLLGLSRINLPFPNLKQSVVIRRVVNVMPIIFVVVLRMSTRMSTVLGYEFDECVSTSRIRKRR
jgi:hypothetical protein